MGNCCARRSRPPPAEDRIILRDGEGAAWLVAPLEKAEGPDWERLEREANAGRRLRMLKRRSQA